MHEFVWQKISGAREAGEHSEGKALHYGIRHRLTVIMVVADATLQAQTRGGLRSEGFGCNMAF